MADKLVSSKLVEKQDKGHSYLLVYENVFKKPTGETYTKKSYTWVSKKKYEKHPKWYGGKKKSTSTSSSPSKSESTPSTTKIDTGRPAFEPMTPSKST